jgi:hypothetical protein
MTTKTTSSTTNYSNTNNNSKVAPTVVVKQFPTIPKPVKKNNRQSSTSSIQTNSILSSIDSDSDGEEEEEDIKIGGDGGDGGGDSMKMTSSFQTASNDDGGDNNQNNNHNNNKNSKNDESKAIQHQHHQQQQQIANKQETQLDKVLVFESLRQALESTESKMEHIRSFIYKNNNQNIRTTTAMHNTATNTANTHNVAGTGTTSTTLSSMITNQDRPYLWSKVICGKVLQHVQSSSFVDSFMTWNTQEFQYEEFMSKQINHGLEDDGLIEKILNDVNVLAYRIVHSSSTSSSSMKNFQMVEHDDDNGNGDDNNVFIQAKRDLCSLLVFYYRSTSNITTSKKASSFASILRRNDKPDIKKGPDDDDNEGDNNNDTTSGNDDDTGNKDTKKEDNESSGNSNMDDVEKGIEKKDGNDDVKKDEEPQTIEWKSLLGPIAATLLSANIPVEVASVMLSKIISTLPLISLAKFERVTAVKSLHQQLYFLVYYHLPLLVLHLDRYAPGWHWPRIFDLESEENSGGSEEEKSITEKVRNAESNGTIPITWFASLLAGEGTNDTLEQTKLLSLWDILITCDDPSLKFFLALALLEKHTDSLMMLRGQALVDELTKVMSLQPTTKIDDESFLGNQNANSSKNSNVFHWYQDAKSLQESTPFSVTDNLRKAEDVAVNHILTMRSKIAMEKMKDRLETEAEAHRIAVEEENDRKAEARKYQYYKKRLETFYDRHCPEKKDSVDTILERYKDKYLILDGKLENKYGSGFLPMLSLYNHTLTNQTNKFISNVGQGIEKRKKNLVASRAKERAAQLDEEMMGPGTYQVAARVSASEILPYVCSSKGQINTSHDSLKYFLVDSRPKETVTVQGGFPTAVHLSPEDLMDPDQIQEKVDMFESLRGAVHICIMVSLSDL